MRKIKLVKMTSLIRGDAWDAWDASFPTLLYISVRCSPDKLRFFSLQTEKEASQASQYLKKPMFPHVSEKKKRPRSVPEASQNAIFSHFHP
jgi:hypothetical protein